MIAGDFLDASRSGGSSVGRGGAAPDSIENPQTPERLEPGKSLLAEPQSCRDANHTEKSPATTCCPRIPSIRCTANSDLIPEPDGVRKEEPRPLRQKRFLWRGVYVHRQPRWRRRPGAAW